MKLLVAFLLLIACVSLSYGAAANCGTWKDPKTGDEYDLAGLTTPTDDRIDSPTIGGTIYWNYCKVVSAVQCPNPPMITQFYSGSCTSLGYGPADFSVAPNGVYIHNANNQAPECTNNRGVRETKLQIVCDKGVEKTVSSFVESSECQYLGVIRSKYGCVARYGKGGHNPGGISGGWVFVIVVLAGFALYLMVGVVVKWRVMHAEPGIDLLPNSEFWQGLPGLIKDGFVFVKNKLTGASGYSSV